MGSPSERQDGAPSRLLTTEEVATRLRVPVATIYAWRHSRKGPPAAQIGRSLRWPEDKLEEWLRAQFEAS